MYSEQTRATIHGPPLATLGTSSACQFSESRSRARASSATRRCAAPRIGRPSSPSKRTRRRVPGLVKYQESVCCQYQAQPRERLRLDWRCMKRNLTEAFSDGEVSQDDVLSWVTSFAPLSLTFRRAEPAHRSRPTAALDSAGPILCRSARRRSWEYPPITRPGFPPSSRRRRTSNRKASDAQTYVDTCSRNISLARDHDPSGVFFAGR